MKISIIVVVVYLFAIFVDLFSSEVIETNITPKSKSFSSQNNVFKWICNHFKKYSFITQNINLNKYFIDCDGRVILSSIGESQKTIEFKAEKVRKRRSPRIKFKKTHFKTVTVEGTCCWKAWSSRNGGSFHRITSASFHVPFDPNPIRAIEFLDENCSRDSHIK